jgi:hypothetical protein
MSPILSIICIVLISEVIVRIFIVSIVVVLKSGGIKMPSNPEFIVEEIKAMDIKRNEARVISQTLFIFRLPL